MMYQAYQTHANVMWPLRTMARMAVPMLMDGTLGLGGHATHRKVAAACKLMTLTEVTHKRPPWAIDTVLANGRTLEVVEEVVTATPFGTLLRFAKPAAEAQPRVLVVAPMSGHFATLLRDTIRTMLIDHDVYVTDWHNARDVPLAAGRFGMDEYTEHIIDFLAAIGPGAHLMAICQPCVASLAAVALMSEDRHPATAGRAVHRLCTPGRAARRPRSRAGVQLPGARGSTPAAGAMLDHAHQCAHARDHQERV